MACTINNLSPIRKIYFECQETILDKYLIPSDKRIIISSINYLVIPVDSGQYTRLEEGDKSNFKDSFRKPFIVPRNIRVGFSLNIDDNSANVRRCLEFLAISSISTANGNAYIPVTCLDYVRPEYEDDVFTTRKGMLMLGAGTGYSGANSDQSPLYTEPYDISFTEIFKRIVI